MEGGGQIGRRAGGHRAGGLDQLGRLLVARRRGGEGGEQPGRVLALAPALERMGARLGVGLPDQVRVIAGMILVSVMGAESRYMRGRQYRW